jgi:cell division protein FtsZ
MGGGTGTGAAPVIARMARERGILTVGVVTKPFTFEGVRRSKAADVGIAELQQFVDTLIVIPNQNLFRLANEKTGWKEAFKMADHVLYMGVRGVTDLMVAPGLVNLDFADIRTVMAEMGKAMMGTGEADGENRAIRAAEAAISNPLLEDTSMAGARGLLINITGGEDMTLFEVDQAANRIREEVAEDANIIFGSAVDDNLAGRIRVSVVATGIDTPIQLTAEPAAPGPRLVAVGGGAQAAAPAVRVEAPRPEHRQATAAQAPQRFPVSAGATAVAYAPQDEEEEQHHQQQAAMPAPQPRPAQQHPLFTQQAAPEPAPQPHRASLFGMVTGGWRRAPQPPAQQEMPDLRHQRPEPRFAEQPREPTAQVRAAIAEPEPQGLDIPAFLRRQDSGR